MYDLIMLSSKEDYTEAKIALAKIFPGCTLEDASDFIHVHRLSIDVPEKTDEEYRVAILEEGLALHSFNFQSFILGKPDEAKAMIDDWVGRMKE